MGRVPHLALTDPARAFAERLLARHPDREQLVAPYERVNAADTTEAGSLWVEGPSPGDPAAPLWAIVQGGEALLGLGHRAAEANFDWDHGEQDAAIDGTLDFIDEVAAAEVVGARERHRFLWRTWETCQFRQGADVTGDRSVVRISAWPAPGGQHRDAAT